MSSEMKNTYTRSDARPSAGRDVPLIIVACALLFLAAVSSPLFPLVSEESAADSPPYSPTGTPVGGNITGNVTWNATGNPYWIEEELTILPNATLTIGQGVEVLFNQFLLLNATVRVYGTLDIRGTVTEPVLMAWDVTPPPSLAWHLWARDDGSILARNATMDHGCVWKGTPGAGMRGDLVLEQVDILSPQFAVSINDARMVIITKSRITSEGGGIDAWSIEFGEFTFNTIHFAEIPAGEDGIEVKSDSNVRIHGNVIDGFGRGVYVNAGSVSVTENDISGCGNGILLWATRGTLVLNNQVYDNIEGIYDNGGVGNVIAGNHASDSRWWGIGLWQTQSTIIRDNALVGNRYGLMVEDSSFVNVFNNTIEANEVGIRLDSGQQHRVYHNWIMYNGIQATDSSLGSYWNDWYPSGGNHWSDYVGDDLFNGMNQDIPGPDGFGDTPYYIPTMGVDWYPFYSVPAPGVPRELTAKAVGSDIVLTWRESPMADSYLLYTANKQTEFDFSQPIKIGNVTSWTIPGAASSPGVEYYVMRAHNSTLNRSSATGNTAGKWTYEFPAGISTFSLPLSPYPWVNYSSVDWVGNLSAFSFSTGALSTSYLEKGNWLSVPGNGDPDRAMVLGEGYSLSFSAQTAFTFTGLPASMIDYGEWPPYPLGGFDPATTARDITATTIGNDVVIEWSEIPGFEPPNGTYQVYCSMKPGGLRGYPGVDYLLLDTVPATGLPRASAVHTNALLSSGQWYYLVVPVRDVNWRGSSTYSIGVITMVYERGSDTFALPLRPIYDHTLDWYCDAIPDVAGMAYMIYDLWKYHAREMPEGVYHADVLQGEGYQISIEGRSARFTFVGF
jgi:parallel beta-helix repeat protein